MHQRVLVGKLGRAPARRAVPADDGPDRAADVAGRDELAKERAALVAAARESKREGGPPAGGMRGRMPRYLEDTDQSGNDCGAHEGVVMPFVGEADRRAKLAGAEGSR